MRHLLLFAICSLSLALNTCCNNSLATDKVSIEDLQNAAEQAIKAKAEKKQLILYVAATNCTFCKKLNRDVIHPALSNHDYASRFIIRRLWLDKNRIIVAFNNKSINEQTLLSHYGIRYTPTLLFVDQDGKEVAPRLEGYSPDTLYWDRLERSLKIAKDS